MKEITTQEFREKLESGENFVLDLYATWCGPCKIMLYNLTQLDERMREDNQENLDCNFYKMDIDKDRDFVMEELGVRSVPTIKFFKNGKEYFSKVGIMPTKEVSEILMSK